MIKTEGLSTKTFSFVLQKRQKQKITEKIKNTDAHLMKKFT